MKRLKTILVAILACLSLGMSVLGLSSCGVFMHAHQWQEEVSRPATCEEEGELRIFCKCGESHTETIPATGHTYTVVVTPPTCLGLGYTTHTCHCGDTYRDENKEALGHSFTNYVFNNDATCTENGTETAVCDNGCGEERTRLAVGTVLPHDYRATVTPPTCEGRGFTTYTCACGANYKDDYVDALGHTMSAVITAPTCFAQGYTTYTCHCGYTEKTDYVNALTHTYTAYTYNNDAACEVDGTETATCDHGCGTEDTRAAVGTALGHTYTAYTYNNDALCEVDGTETAICDHGCGTENTRTAVGTALTHTYTAYTYNNDALCEVDGTETATCDHGCGTTYTRTAADTALEHIYNNYVYNDDALCETDGTETAICERGCGTTHTRTAVDTALGHDFVYYFSDNNATCTEDGTKTATCGRWDCDVRDTVVDEGSAPGHLFVNYVSNNDMTCTEDGTKTAVCEQVGMVCAETHTLIDEGSAWGHDYVELVCTVCEDVDDSEGLQFTVNSDGTSYTVTGLGKCKDTMLGIPETYEGLPVTAIGVNAFWNASNVQLVAIPNTVTSIGNRAFDGCYSLQKVHFGDNVETIGTYAFYNCNALTQLVFPESLTSIGSKAFADCEGLVSVQLSENLRNIGGSAFLNCYKLVEVYNPSALNVTLGAATNGYVGYYAKEVFTQTYESNLTTDVNGFILYADGAEKLLMGYAGTEKNVVLPDGATKIYPYAFYENDFLSVTIPETVTEIGNSAFEYGTELSAFVLPASLQRIGRFAFASTAYAAKESNWTDGVLYAQNYLLQAQKGFKGDCAVKAGTTLIADHAFVDCGGLLSVTMPDSLVRIGESAFERCYALTKVTLGAGLTTIGENVFRNCYKLIEVCNKSSLAVVEQSDANGYVGYYAKNVYLNEADAKLTRDENGYILYTDGAEKSLIGYVGAETALTLPADVTRIYQYAFYKNTTVKSVTMGAALTDIGEYAFSECAALTGVVIPAAVTNIGEDAFSNCTALVNAIIGESVQTIGADAFGGCTSLVYVELGENVNSIGKFAFYGCYKLVEVYNKSSLSVKVNASNGYLGYYAKNVYANEAEGKLTTDVNGYIVYTDGDTKILIGYVGEAEHLTLPADITEIYDYAFYKCVTVKTVVIGNSVTKIGMEAFYKCTALQSVDIGDAVVEIGTKVFSGCVALTDVTLPASLEKVGESAFELCEALANVVYEGTADAWANVTVGEGNECLTENL